MDTAIYEVKLKKKKKKDFKLLLLALPFIILIFIFNYIPLFGWIYAFFDYKPGVPLSKTAFVGLKFFRLIMDDGGDMLRVLKNTLIFSFLGILSSPLPVILAILLNEVRSKKFKSLIQTTTTLPNFVSWIIIFSLSFTIFSNDGVLNQVMMKLGLFDEPSNILGNLDAVYLFQTLLTIWKSLGWSAIIYLASISGIDSELYDAVKVDGAGRFRSILHVTVPGLMPTYIVLLLLGISGLLSASLEQYLVFQNMMVKDNIEILDLYVYRVGIANNDYAYGTAIGVAKTIVSLLLLVSANLMAKKTRGYGIV